MKNETQPIETNTQLKPKATWPQFTCPSEPTEGLLGIITNFAKELNQNTEGVVSGSFYRLPGYASRFRFRISCSEKPDNYCYSVDIILEPDGCLELENVDARIHEIKKIDTEEKLQLFLHDFARSNHVRAAIENHMLKKAIGIKCSD